MKQNVQRSEGLGGVSQEDWELKNEEVVRGEGSLTKTGNSRLGKLEGQESGLRGQKSWGHSLEF